MSDESWSARARRYWSYRYAATWHSKRCFCSTCILKRSLMMTGLAIARLSTTKETTT